jgi:hypothetical protein
MFKAITWGQFTGTVLLLLLLYYAYVGLVYYRVELMGLLKGKGKATGPATAPALPAVVGRGSLVGKPAGSSPAPAAAPPKAPAPAPAPTEATEPDEAEEPAEVGAVTEPATTDEVTTTELPDLDLPTDETVENTVETVNHDALDVDIKSNFTEPTGSNSPLDTDGSLETEPEDSEPGFTIGIAQLGNYLERAADGQITQEELAEQEPALADTDLLVAFFQSSTKSAQRVTSHLYSDVEEPALG